MCTVPGTAPKTDIGSFEVAGTLNSRDIYVYWQQIPEDLYNGDNFEYRVISVEEDGSKRYVTCLLQCSSSNTVN